jgi:hypothetical protein
MLRDIDDEVERELDDQERLLKQTQAREAQMAAARLAAPPAEVTFTEPDASRIHAGGESRIGEPHVLHQVLNELRTTQQQIEALHRAWLAQATLLKRHAFPGRWVMVVLAAMILTWVFSRFQLSWG